MQAPERSFAPFTSEDWLFEVKYDGYRGLARVEGGSARLFTKSRIEATTWFPEIAASLSKLAGGPHILDGEIAILDDLGRSQFQALRERAARRRWYPGARPCTYVAFDLLMLDGIDTREMPLGMRKDLLAELLAPFRRRPEGVLYLQDLDADEALFTQIVLPLELEGFMAKLRTGPYLSGVRSDLWRKIKRKGAVEPQRFRNRSS